MLESTDRIALAVQDIEEAIDKFELIFDCIAVDDFFDKEACARRVTLQWGTSQLELLHPRGPGPVSDFLEQGKKGLFAAGFALENPAELAAHFRTLNIPVYHQEGERYVVFPDDGNGIGIILSPATAFDPIGLCDKIWQVSFAVNNLETSLDWYTKLLCLDGTFVNRYKSQRFAFDAAIRWFEAVDGGRLDSIEILQPHQTDSTMSRFLNSNGNGIYMASIETERIPQIVERVKVTGVGWVGNEFGGFIGPDDLNGLLLGLVSYKDWNSKRPLPAKLAATHAEFNAGHGGNA